MEALAGLEGHLTIQPPPDSQPVTLGDAPPPGRGDGAQPEPEAALLLAAGYRLRLAVAAAARDSDQTATIALIREGARDGLDATVLDATVLLAVAARHWPKPRLRTRARQAGQRWAVGCARWAWVRRPTAGRRSSWPSGTAGRERPGGLGSAAPQDPQHQHQRDHQHGDHHHDPDPLRPHHATPSQRGG
jgi:hypothetical protein